MKQVLVIILIIFASSHQSSLEQDSNSQSTENDPPAYSLRHFMRLKKSNLESTSTADFNSCVINIVKDRMLTETNSHLKWPLVLEPIEQPKFMKVDYKGDIFVKSGDKLRLVCSGDRNRFSNIRVANADILVTCKRGKFFDYMGTSFNFEMLGCVMMPESDDVVIGDGHHQIGFTMPNGQLLPLIDINYDNHFQIIHATHKIPYISYKIHQSAQRIPFRDGKHPLGRGINRYYQRTEVFEKMVKILGIKAAQKYFNEGSFITRGHMTPKGDFPFSAQQLATFFFININPQFSGFNNKNWNFLEMSIRQNDFGGEVTVHTGASRILQLPSKASGKNETIYLANNSKLPIPEIFWKIVEIGTDKYSFVGLNSPTIKSDEFEAESHLCNDLCDTEQYSWLSQDLKSAKSRKDPTKGYLLCCSFEEVEKIIDGSK